MRVTSELFVAQLIRRVFAAGGFGAVRRRGAAEAGAIFVLGRGRDGRLTLYSPAVQSLSGADGERRFLDEGDALEDGLDRRFEKEARFDPDFWLVEIETDRPHELIEIAES